MSEPVAGPHPPSEQRFRLLRWLSWVMVAAGSAYLYAHHDAAGMPFAPLALGPMIFSILLAHRVRGRASQFVLFVSAILHFAWFLIAVRQASHSGIVFVGVYSLPVMVLFWCAAWWTRERHGEPPPPDASDSSDRSDSSD